MTDTHLREFEALCERLSITATDPERRAMTIEFLTGIEPDSKPACVEGDDYHEIRFDGTASSAATSWAGVLKHVLLMARDAAEGLSAVPILSEQAFAVKLGSEIRRARRYNSILCILGFSSGSSTHPLRPLLQALRRSIRESDHIGARGRRPFVLLPSTDRDGGEVTAARLTDILRVEDPEGAWKSGMCLFPYDGWAEEELVSKIERE